MHVISLAHYAIMCARGWAANSISARVRLADNAAATTCGSVFLLLLGACGTATAQQEPAPATGRNFLVVGDISMLTRIERWGKLAELLKAGIRGVGRGQGTGAEVRIMTPDGRGRGVLWWYPEAIPVKGLKIWNDGATALFDGSGNVLPAAGAFRRWPKTGKARIAPTASPS